MDMETTSRIAVIAVGLKTRLLLVANGGSPKRRLRFLFRTKMAFLD